MESELSFAPKPEKPSVLYHATRSGEIVVFEPRNKKTRSDTEGPKVFGAPSKALATIFLVEWDDSWARSGTIDGIPYIVISDFERFKKADVGGYMYTLPSNSFENDPDIGSGENEWTSSTAVTPTEKEFIPSAIQAMIENGVQVYFVNQNTFTEILNAPNYGCEIIQGLVPENNK